MAELTEELKAEILDFIERYKFQHECYLYWIREAEEAIKEFDELEKDNYELDVYKEEKMDLACARMRSLINKSNLEQKEMDKLSKELQIIINKIIEN